MKTYPKYKDSGISWIGQIPEHWEVRKFKFCFNERNEKNHPMETKLSATQTQGVIPQTLYETKGYHVVDVNKDFDKLKFVKVGDFVIHLRSFQGGIEYAYYQGIISAAYTILTPLERKSAQYYKYLMKSFPFIQLLKTCVTGIREGQNIDYSILGNRSIPIVPNAEQEQIVRWIESKTLKIDTYVAERERELAILSELRQAEIARAVTHGLNPDVPMKDTGIPWIPQIPEHWKLKRLKKVVNLISEKTSESMPYVALDQIEGFTGRLLNVSNEQPDSQCNAFKKGDVLFNKLRPYLAKCILAEFDGKASSELLVLRNFDGEARFLQLLLLSHGLLAFIDASTYGSKMPRASWDFIGDCYIPIPPKEEQRAIIDYLDNKILNIDTLISSLTHQLELLKEYKQRLISDAVTGKIDVRSKEIPTDAQ